ncbi:MAG: YfhO family protein [Anaerolineales bacterium]|nr:YfhO family protein [Anaerolineales bacterium]MDW8276642.1 YfhO family protein [Anaerolineales bacterium]
MKRTDAAILALYLLLPWFFFGLGVDVLRAPLAPGDGYISGLPTKLFGASLSAWNPYLQAGTFTFKDIGFQFLYLPSVVVMALFPNPFGYNLLILSHYALAGMFTFLFLRKLRLDAPPAFLGGLAFMFCGFASAHLAHYMIIVTMAYLPILLYAIETWLQSRRWLHLALAALAFGLNLFGDYPAVSLYIGMVSFPYLWFRALTGQESPGEPLLARLKTALLASAVIFPGGVAIAAAQVFPILESLPLVTREKISYEFFASFSFPLYQLPMLLFPYLFGANRESLFPAPYFGEPNLMELTGYVGILPLFLSALALLLPKRDRQVYFWALVALGAFLLALGDSTPLYRLMYRVPLYNMFRVPARNWLEFSFATAALSALAAQALLHQTLEKKTYFLLLAALSAAFLAWSGFVLFGWDSLFPHLREQEAWLQNLRLSSPTVYLPLAFLMLSILGLALLYRYRQTPFMWGALSLLLLADLFTFGRPFNEYPRLLFVEGQPNPAAEYIRQAPGRVYPLNFQGQERELQPNLNMLYGIPVINAYSNIWLKDYVAITTFNLDAPAGRKRDLIANNRVLSVLSTRYLITSSAEQKDYIARVKASGGNQPGEVLVQGFDSPGWEFVSPASASGTIATLQGRREGKKKEPGLLQISFPIQPNATYQVTLEARIPVGTAAKPLIVDFFGKNYDGAGQERLIDPLTITKTFRSYRFLIFTHDYVPAESYLRVFTYSEQPYEVRNVTLTRLESQDIPVPLWQGEAEGDTALYRRVYDAPNDITLYENRNALPRARFVERVIPVNGWGDVFYYLWLAPEFDPSTTALAEGLPSEWTGLSLGEILEETYENETVTLRIRTNSQAFLVLADTWYPGWKAFIDGQETPIYKTYGTLRGISIGAPGEHRIEFRFVPMSFYLGLGVSLISTLLLFLTALSLDRRKMT